MWKYLLVTLFLATVLHAEDNDENLDHRIIDDVFNDNIRRKCLKVHNNTQIYRHAMDARDKCIRTQLHGFPETEEEFFESICADKCMENYMKEVESCLSPEEQYLPEFLSSSKEEQCKDDGKVFKDKMKGYFQVKCEGSPIKMVWYAISMVCTKKLKFMHHKSEPDFVLSLSDICSDFKTYQECALLEVVPQACGSDDYVKYVSVFFEPYLNWCKLNGNDLQ